MKEYKYTCQDCGVEFTYERYKRPGHRLCDDCAMKHIRDSATQLIDKKGPYYDRWLKRMEIGIERASEGMRRFLSEQGRD